jgi:endonuclease/exonuclease/phosphatase (EEP) superfamily protein YafD
MSRGNHRSQVEPLDIVLIAVAIIGVACVVSRWLSVDSPPVVAAAVLTPLMSIPLAGTAIVAFLRRRPVLGCTSLVCFLIAAGVTVARFPTRDQQPTSGPPLTVITANVYHQNDDVAGAVTTLTSLDADVLVLQEVSPQFAATLEAPGHRAGYQWTEIYPDDGSTGLAVLSRKPIVRHRLVGLGQQPMLEVDVAVGGTIIRVFNVHIEAPVTPKAAERWGAQLDSLRSILDSADQPFVAVGDFNATVDNLRFRRLLTQRQDAALRHVWPWFATWPDRIPLLPPIVQLDHVVTSQGIETTDLRSITCPGSDHRLLFSSIVVPTGA